MNCDTSKHFKTLVLFSDKFPFGAVTEHTFILPDIEAASKCFDKVIVIPSAGSLKDANMPNIPPNVEIDLGWINSPYGRNRWLRAIKLLQPSTWQRTKGDTTRRGLTMSMYASAASDYLKSWIAKNHIYTENTLFYTFWFDLMAGALAVLSQKQKLNWVSRAHGFDIYDTRGGRLRDLMIQSVDTLYVASQRGCSHLQKNYPYFGNKIKTSLLGSYNISDVTTLHHRKEDKKLTFLSVSNIIDIKRVDMNARLLIALAKGRPSTKIHWIHLGGGNKKQDLELWLKSQLLPENFSYELSGEVTNEYVHHTYQSETIDWSILLSRREGGNPISAAESLSYGVPMIATDAGGLGEIVTDECGILLPVDVREEEFVRGILPFLDSENRYLQLSAEARKRWENHYNAKKLRIDFFKKLNATLQRSANND